MKKILTLTTLAFLCFCNLNAQDITDAFKQVISIADKCNARIHLLRINTETDFNSIELGLDPIEKMLQNFPELKNYSKAVYNEPSVETGINTFLEQHPLHA